MRLRQSIFLTALLVVSTAASASTAADFDGLPLVFEPNRGQADSSVLFLARAAGETVFINGAEVILSLRTGADQAAVKISFPGARTAQLTGGEALAGQSHYLRGSDPAGWMSAVPHFARVRAEGVWEGVSVEFHGNQHRLEYDFIVAPGADPARIRLRFDPVAALRVDERGDLALETADGPLHQERPVAYQETGGERRPVEVSYRIGEDGEIAFQLGDYDPSLPLVIDPVVSFATFIGGTGFDEASAVAVDQSKNIYVAGTAHSTDLPTTLGAVQPDYRSGTLPGDAFVAKLNPSGSTVVWATYLGGTRNDTAVGVALDAGGNVYLAGRTESSDFPWTFGASQQSRPGFDLRPDGFVAKLSASGSVLVYSTYLGGSGSDLLNGLAVDVSGNAYVAGATDSTNFPTTPGAFQSGSCPNLGLSGFVTKLNSNGSAPQYSTMLCGSSTDEVFGVAVDTQGVAYVTGRTRSNDFPVRGPAPQPVGDPFSGDAFAAKLSANGSALLYSTYLGGTADDGGTAIAVDTEGNAYVAGYTRSADLAVTAGAFQMGHADNGLFEDAFVTVLNSAGSAFVYSSYLGGSANDRASAIAVDADQRAHLVGRTESADFPGSGERCQTGFGGQSDAFVSRFNRAGSGLAYSMYLGGIDDDRALDVALDAEGGAVVAGLTRSRNFPTTQNALRTAYANGYGGATDAFVVRIEDRPAPIAPCVALNGVVNGASFLPGPLAPGEIVSLFGDGLGPAAPESFTLIGDRIGSILAGTQVLFDGDAAPVVATSNGQVNAIVPYSVAGKQRVVVQVDYEGQRTEGVAVPVAASSPAIFALNRSGRGPGAVLNQDFTVNGAGNPAAKGSVIQIFATGEGQTNPAGIDGRLAPNVIAELPLPALGVAVTIGGLPAVVQYAGAAPGLVAGLIQVNAFVPLSVASGSAIPVLIHFEDNTSPAGVTVAIE